MKKYIFLILSLLLLTGCTADYELEINGDKIKEKLIVLETNVELFDKENDSGWTIRDSFNALIEEDEFSKDNYKVKSLNTETQLGIEYSNNKLESVINSTALNQCYTNPSVTINKNIVKIKTGNNFDCYELYDDLESVNVIFKTNHKVISTNADSKHGNKYVWEITKSGNKNIEISYDNSKSSVNFLVYVCIATIVFILIIFVSIVGIKLKKKNKF